MHHNVGCTASAASALPVWQFFGSTHAVPTIVCDVYTAYQWLFRVWQPSGKHRSWPGVCCNCLQCFDAVCFHAVRLYGMNGGCCQQCLSQNPDVQHACASGLCFILEMVAKYVASALFVLQVARCALPKGRPALCRECNINMHGLHAQRPHASQSCSRIRLRSMWLQLTSRCNRSFMTATGFGCMGSSIP